MSRWVSAPVGLVFAVALVAIWHLPGGDHIKQGLAISLGIMVGIDLGALIVAGVRQDHLLENLGGAALLMVLIAAGSYADPRWLGLGFLRHGGWSLFHTTEGLPDWYRTLACAFSLTSAGASFWLLWP